VKPQIYDLSKPENLKAALLDLRGFWKLWSACLLTKCGLPTLDGVIVTGPYPELQEDVHRFLKTVGSAEALIRHDKRPEKPPYPRGGFLVGEPLLHDAIKFFFSLSRIVAVYEKADPLLNMHNINLLFENERDVSVEVVGPGFDASDLQRGDITPHEIFSISLSAEKVISRIKLVQRVDQAAYEESLTYRKDKIKKRLASSPTEALARKIRANLRIPDDLDAHLKAIGSPLCQSTSYQPVPEKLLRDTVTKIVDSPVLSRYAKMTGAGFPLNFSTSLVNKGSKQVFWDIVSPALKFQGLPP
jgi:hypothetical protein